jgi:hypothetical protein
LTPPNCDPSPIFADDNPKSHARATVASIAQPTQLQQAIAKWIDHHYRRGWRRNRDRRSNCHRAALWRDNNPGPIGTLLVASALIVTVAARSQLTLRSNDSPSGPSDDRADSSPTAAA